MASPALSYIPGQQHLVAAPDAGWNPRSGAGVQWSQWSQWRASGDAMRCYAMLSVSSSAGGVDGLLEVGGPAWRAESQCRSQWGAAIADMIIWPTWATCCTQPMSVQVYSLRGVPHLAPNRQGAIGSFGVKGFRWRCFPPCCTCICYMSIKHINELYIYIWYN